MILLLDNYDSFVYNIREWLSCNSRDVIIRRNDSINGEEALQMGVQHIIISPGPMGPDSAGNARDVVARCAGNIPILGICLGHQCIADAFGCTISEHPVPLHGKTSPVKLFNSVLYRGLPSGAEWARYHSLYINRKGFNHSALRINACLEDGTIMGIEHCVFPVFGIQFHPESILTGYKLGSTLFNNFLALSANTN